MIARRGLLAVLAAAALSRPSAAAAAEMPMIGFLTPRSRPTPPAQDAFSQAFLGGMAALGYAEGKNLRIEWRYANGDYSRLPPYADDLVRLNPALIVSYGTPATRALQKATRTIPIVVAAAIDLVGSGFVASLARPGGNITGLSVIDIDMSVKQLELLKALVPTPARIAVLVNPGNPAHAAIMKAVEKEAPGLGVVISAVPANTPQGIAEAFDAMARDHTQAAIIAADAFFSGQGHTIAEAALKAGIATIGVYAEHISAGTLMSYGPDIASYHRRAAIYVDKMLKGAKPENLPAEEPTKIELAINAATAEKLGIKVPTELLARADHVIE